MFLDYRFDHLELATAEPMILRHLESRFEPILRLSTMTDYVNMHTRFFTGEKEEPESFDREESWAHQYPSYLSIVRSARESGRPPSLRIFDGRE
jgi:hypothetical protein